MYCSRVCSFFKDCLYEIVIKESRLTRIDPTLESLLKSIPGGNNVIDKLTLLLQKPTSNAKVGGTSSVTHVNGGLLVPNGAIICNTTNSELAKNLPLLIPRF